MGKISFGHYKPILISFLIGVTAFSTFKYISSLKETYDLTTALNELKEEVAVLENEKQTMALELDQEKQTRQLLSVEAAKLKEDLKVSEEKLASVSENIIYIQNELESVRVQVEGLKNENSILIAEKSDLQNQVSLAVQEKDALNARLNSVIELKKALKEVKQKMRAVRAQVKDTTDRQTDRRGNRGFIIKDGKPTFPAKVKIEVTTSMLPQTAPAPALEPTP